MMKSPGPFAGQRGKSAALGPRCHQTESSLRLTPHKQETAGPLLPNRETVGIGTGFKIGL